MHSEWVRPSDALARYAAGDLDLIFPTLAHVARARVVRDAPPRCSTRSASRTVRPIGRRSSLPTRRGQRVALSADDGEHRGSRLAPLTSQPDLDTAALLAELTELEAELAETQGVA